MDLRLPTGLFFAIVGTLLCGMGVVGPASRARLTDANINLYTGLVMLGFGGILLWLSRRQS